MRASLVAGLLLLALCVLACERGPVGTRDTKKEREPDPGPAPSRGGLEAITAVVPCGGFVFAGTESGILRLDPTSGVHGLLAGDADVSHAGVTDLACAPDATLWSSHARRVPSDEAGDGSAEPRREVPRRGGVRSLDASSGMFEAWFAEDGLGSDDVSCIAAPAGRVVVGAGAGIAQLDTSDRDAEFVARFGESNRLLRVVDLAQPEDEGREVVEFQPRNEAVLCLAATDTHVVVGTTHGLYRLDEAGTTRFQVPCRLGKVAARTTLAVALMPDAGIVASLGVATRRGGYAPAGLLELRPGSRYQCHVPGVDVPASLALDLAVDGTLVFVATYEGLTRMQGRDVELLDRDAGAPPGPVTAVAGDGKGGCWVGTWGRGLWHLAMDRTWTLYRFASASGTTQRSTGRLR